MFIVQKQGSFVLTLQENFLGGGRDLFWSLKVESTLYKQGRGGECCGCGEQQEHRACGSPGSPRWSVLGVGGPNSARSALVLRRWDVMQWKWSFVEITLVEESRRGQRLAGSQETH